MSWPVVLVVVGLGAAVGTAVLGYVKRWLRPAAGLAVVTGGTLPWPRDVVQTFSQVVSGWFGGAGSALGQVAPWGVAAAALVAFGLTVRSVSRAALGWGLAVVPALSLIPGPAEHVGSGVLALLNGLAAKAP